MAPGDGPPLSLRPFPVADSRPKNLADFIARVNAQPGGFRSVTEEKLHDEIRQSEGRDLAVEDDDEDMSNGDEEADDKAAPKDPNLARMEVLRNIDLAGNSALMTLDSLSLLLSKHNPTQAGVTLSQQLRELVGIGTMGMDKLNDSNTTPAKTRDRETIAMGWTLMETNRARDAAEEATAFLTREVSAEGAYWEDVISVHKRGWSICKVPQERHTLGVKFGFSEAAPEFRNNGLAPMRRGEDGAAQLDVGRLGGVSEGLVVTYERDGQVVGRSTSRALTDSTSLESRVLDARNTIFSQELWHELTRESRSFAAYDVKLDGSRLIYALTPTDSIVIELLPLASPSPPAESLPMDTTAETVSMSLHLLLSHAHRYNELMRTRPISPHIPRMRGQQPHPLLRPIISHSMALEGITSTTRYVGGLVQAFRRAGLPSSFVLRTTQLTHQDPASSQLSGSQTLVRSLLQSQDFALDLAIVPDAILTVRGRTFIFPVTATYYYVVAPPGSSLLDVCAPFADGYTDLEALADYLRTATARLLARHFSIALSAHHARDDFIHDLQETSIRNFTNDALDLRFAVHGDAAAAESPSLVLASVGITQGNADGGGDGDGEETGKQKGRTWQWSATAGETLSIDDVVRSVADQALS